MFIFVSVLLVLTIGLSAGFFMMWSKLSTLNLKANPAHNTATSPDQTAALGTLFSLDTFIVNLADQERNRYLMLLKSLRWPTFLILMPVLLLMEVISWAFVLLREPGRYRNKLDAYKWIVNNWGSIQDKRRHVQSLRQVSDRELLLKNSRSISFDQVDQGFVGSTAQAIFNPLFFLFY